MINLEQLEKRLQTLIEVQLLAYLPGPRKEGVVAQQLAMAVQSNLREQEDGSKLAPNLFTLIANPGEVEKWKGEPRLFDTLREILDTVAQETGFQYAGPLAFQTAIDTSMPADQMRVAAAFPAEAEEETVDAIPAEADSANGGPENIPSNAFLIVHGTKVFPLDRTVINIGRRMDNHLVVDDPRVSRNHSQLRAIKGRFVVFDLNSTGGTFVNGQRVNQTILYPGDVISLAGVPLIYGQDNPPARSDLAETSPLSPIGGDRPTAILKLEDQNKK
jgi:hypothetical protein